MIVLSAKGICTDKIVFIKRKLHKKSSYIHMYECFLSLVITNINSM